MSEGVTTSAIATVVLHMEACLIRLVSALQYHDSGFSICSTQTENQTVEVQLLSRKKLKLNI